MKVMYVFLCLCLVGLVLSSGCAFVEVFDRLKKAEKEEGIERVVNETESMERMYPFAEKKPVTSDEPEETPMIPDETDSDSGNAPLKGDANETGYGTIFQRTGYGTIEDIDGEVTQQTEYQSGKEEDEEDDTSGYVDYTSTGGGYTITESETCRLDIESGEIICEPVTGTPTATVTSDLPPARRESVEGEGTVIPTMTVTGVIATPTTAATLPPTTIPTTFATTRVATTAPTSTLTQDSYSWFTQGLDLYAKGDYHGAVTAFDNSIALDSGQKSVWYNKALALIMLGRYSEAVDSATRAVRLDPNYASGWVAKGIAESKQGMYSASVESYTTALSLNPGDYVTWNNLGVVYYNMGKYQDAVNAYDHALSIRPDYTTAQQNREKALAKL